jgi:hypothetical protein
VTIARFVKIWNHECNIRYPFGFYLHAHLRYRRNQRFKTTGVFRLTKKLFGVMALLQLVLCVLCGGVGSADAQVRVLSSIVERFE